MKMKIAFQGERGAYSEQAALCYFGPKIAPKPKPSFKALFHAIADGTADFSIVPIENSLAGSVHENYDLLLKFSPRIIGELYLHIDHHLLALPGTKLENVRLVLSHPQALNQCRDYLETLAGVELVPMYDTAGSAKHVAENRLRDAAAIASAQAAADYDLVTLAKDIETNRENFTRFLVIQRPDLPVPEASVTEGGNIKTSIVFSTKDIPGALFKSLAVFALRDINLGKIESRPLHGKPFQYIFYLDFVGSAESEAQSNALKHLEEITHFVRVLGSYPGGETFGAPAEDKK